MITSTAYGHLIYKSNVPHISSGRMRILGVGSAKRNPNYPNVPTISEAGVPGYETSIWWGMFAPPATPTAIINRVHAETTAAMESRTCKKDSRSKAA